MGRWTRSGRSGSSLQPRAEPGSAVRVWDVGVRAFHWGLVGAVVVAALTGFVVGRTALAWHLAAGAAVIAAVAWRVVWGLLGSTYARFGSFAHRPAVVLAHVRDLLAGRHRRHLGHNPLGAMMVFALLGVLARDRAGRHAGPGRHAQAGAAAGVPVL